MTDANRISRRRLIGISAVATGSVAAMGGLAWLTSRPPPSSGPVESAARDDDAQWRVTDPSLLCWREVAPIATTLDKPRDFIAAADDQLLIAGDRALHLVGADGTIIAQRACDSEPRCLAALPGKGILVAFDDRIELHAPLVALANGPATMRWATLPPKALPTALAVAGGDVWLADFGNRRVWHFDAAGRQCGVLGDRCEFIIPSPYFDVVAAADGSVWVANTGRHRLECYGPDGRELRHWGRPGLAMDAFCGCCNPAQVALAPDGRFITAEKGIARVKISRPDGCLESVVAGAESFSRDTVGLVPLMDERGRILVLDPQRRAIRIFISTKAAT
jgi:hypothetical protein